MTHFEAKYMDVGVELYELVLDLGERVTNDRVAEWSERSDR